MKPKDLKLIILQGIPGSGKSTWAREFIKTNSNTHVIVSRDEIRKMFGNYWVPNREGFVDDVEKLSIIEGLNRGFNVIVDATNLNSITVNKLIQIARENVNNVTVEYKPFNTDLKECIRRDSLRENPVGEEVIRKFYRKYIEPTFKDTRLITVQNNRLPCCIICDIDGTLALMNGRNPYDDSLVHTDIVNEPVLNILYDYKEMLPVDIILVSGRQEKSREVTEKWLKANNIPYNFLYMRHTGDIRKDSIVKKELYDKYIKDSYYVMFWLDDRNQVVDMVRKELGLLCLQVYYGDF